MEWRSFAAGALAASVLTLLSTGAAVSLLVANGLTVTLSAPSTLAALTVVTTDTVGQVWRPLLTSNRHAWTEEVARELLPILSDVTVRAAGVQLGLSRGERRRLADSVAHLVLRRLSVSASTSALPDGWARSVRHLVDAAAYRSLAGRRVTVSWGPLVLPVTLSLPRTR